MSLAGGLASELGVGVTSSQRTAARRAVFHFDAHLKRMSTVDQTSGDLVVHTKGALETRRPARRTRGSGQQAGSRSRAAPGRSGGDGRPAPRRCRPRQCRARTGQACGSMSSPVTTDSPPLKSPARSASAARAARSWPARRWTR
ncbi:hypothetical protein ACIO6U_18610 [Streptomyces sp. NPDC087422]|uniref:hypothetical protein n=1 Tax=Streptomyces sp. NPDC087422 TaxID=3365786 RepID=UPI00382D33B0